MPKIEALEYLIENNQYHDEWSGAGMYEAIVEMFKSDQMIDKKYLDKLLEQAKNR